MKNSAFNILSQNNIFLTVLWYEKVKRSEHELIYSCTIHNTVPNYRLRLLPKNDSKNILSGEAVNLHKNNATYFKTYSKF